MQKHRTPWIIKAVLSKKEKDCKLYFKAIETKAAQYWQKKKKIHIDRWNRRPGC